MRVLKDDQVFGSPDVRAIMESDERPKEIKSLFEAFYGAMDRQDLSKAENILLQLEKVLGPSDEELVSCRTRFDLEGLF